MKKILLIVCLFCITFSFAQAQITLDIDDIAAPVKSFDARNDTAVDSTISPGTPGANQTWDFSALNNYNPLPIDVVNPSTVPGYTLFPSANLATIYDSAIIVYFFSRSAAGLLLHGTINDFLKTGDSIRLILSTPDTALALPGIYGNTAFRFCSGDTKSSCTYTYDTSFNGFPVSVPIDTVRIKHEQYKSDELDAWGTVTMPSTYTFPVLRQKNITYSTDSIWGYANVPAPYQSYSGWYALINRKDTTVTYSWWTKDFGLPIVKMTMAPGPAPTQIVAVEWAYNLPEVGIDENEFLNSTVYPNPANDFISISNISGYNEIIIYDVIGNEISRQSIANMDIVKFSVQDLPNGMYFYNAVNANNKASGKFIVKH